MLRFFLIRLRHRSPDSPGAFSSFVFFLYASSLTKQLPFFNISLLPATQLPSSLLPPRHSPLNMLSSCLPRHFFSSWLTGPFSSPLPLFSQFPTPPKSPIPDRPLAFFFSLNSSRCGRGESFAKSNNLFFSPFELPTAAADQNLFITHCEMPQFFHGRFLSSAAIPAAQTRCW